MGVDVLGFNREALVEKFCLDVFISFFLHCVTKASLHGWRFFSSDQCVFSVALWGNEVCKVQFIEASDAKDL